MTKSIEITFPKLNHFWLDSGLVGLTVLFQETHHAVERIVSNEGLTLSGSQDDIKATLSDAYDLLVSRCYNTSTKKQKEEMSGFFFDSKEKTIKRFPKKQLFGVTALLYGENQIFQYDKGLKWENKTAHKLPEKHTEIQSILDDFIGTTGIKPSTSVLLVDSPYQLKPQLDPIDVSGKPRKEHCFLCGHTLTGKAKEITKGTYPFITSSSGFKNFNSMIRSAERVCWKCDYLTKFVPISSFYLVTKAGKQEDIFAFLPYSISFLKMLDTYSPLQDAKYKVPNLFKNFQHPLDGYFQKPFEVTFAFLYTLYRKMLIRKKADENEGSLDWDEMCHFITAKAPLEFVVLHAESKGQTYIGKMVWSFRDSVYFFRLMDNLETSGINIKKVMWLLIDSSQNNANRTLRRNRVCEQILRSSRFLA